MHVLVVRTNEYGTCVPREDWFVAYDALFAIFLSREKRFVLLLCNQVPPQNANAWVSVQANDRLRSVVVVDILDSARDCAVEEGGRLWRPTLVLIAFLDDARLT